MPRFAIVSPDSTGLSLWKRLYDEGADVLVYIEPLQSKLVGDGIIPKVGSFEQLFAWAKQKPTIAFFDASRQGKKADIMRRAGIPVIGGGSLCDRLEEDRSFGEKVGRSLGCPMPPSKEFPTITAAIAYVKGRNDTGFYFKSDRYLSSDATAGADSGAELTPHLEYLREEFGDRVPNIVQEKIDGIAISTAGWFNGQSFVPPYEGTIEHKKFMDGELGPSTGCSFNAVWFYDDEMPKIVRALNFPNFGEWLRQNQAPPGIYDINALISEKDGTAYFLEFTPRFGYDSEPTGARLIDPGIGYGGMLERLVQGRLSEFPATTEKLAYSVRLSVPPYPWEHCQRTDKHTSIGTPVFGADGLHDGFFIPYMLRASKRGGLEVADPSGLVGLGLAVDSSLERAHDRVMTYLKENLRAPGLGYRSDGAAVIAKDAKKLRALGYEIPV